MRKFLSVFGLLALTVVLAIVGIVCLVGITNGNISVDGITPENALLIAGTIGGLGGAIATAILTIANFFTAKTYDK